MAKQNITLDELLTAIKGASVKFKPTVLCQSGSGDISLSQPITDFDLISIEAGDNTDANPDNTLSCRLANSIEYKRAYVDVGHETDGTNTNSNPLVTESAYVHFMFMNARTLRIINQYNNVLFRVRGWKAVIEWGGVL